MNKSERELEKEMIQKFHQRHTKAMNALGEKVKLWTMLDIFDRGDQWKSASIPPWVPKPVTNYIRYIRTLKRANLSSAIAKAHITAELKEQEQFISKLRKAHDHVWEESKVPRVIRRCIDRSLLHGTSVAVVFSDDMWYGEYYGEKNPKNRLYQGKICVRRFPIMNFFPDPDAYDLDTCKFVETTENLPLSMVQNNPKFKAYAGNKLKDIKFQNMDSDDQSSGTILRRDHKPGEDSYVSGDEMVTLHTHWERYYNEQGKWQVDVTYYLRRTDFALLRYEDVKPSEYPFAVLYDEEEDQDFFGTGTAEGVFENQKIINKADQTASIIATLHQNPQKVVSRESGINAQEMARTGTLPGKVWTANGDPAKAVHIPQTPEIPRGLPEVKDRMAADIRETAGINEAYTGASVGSLTTSSGVTSLIERATIRDKDKMTQVDAFVERISHLILMHILYKWEDKRPLMSTQPNGNPDYGEWDPEEVKDVRENLSWRIRSNVYATAPMTLAKLREEANNLMQMQGQFNFDPPIITPEEWIKMQEFEFKDKILERMEADRARMEEEKAQQLAQRITQVADMIRQSMAQGMSQQQAVFAAQQEAQRILDEQEMAKRQGKRPRDAAQQAQAPQGITGQQAMQSMARGR